MNRDPVISVRPLGFVWETVDPFLFCVHHDDAYPAGNAQLGPAVSLAGRNLGSDFVVKDGFRMYHGQVVPGFPQHPHRGFETITLVRRGLIDHSDSLGARARFGGGDVQWMTAGKGIVHSEMFPLLDRTGPNPVELFQIWLNLPRVDKLVEPHFSMLWSHQIPKLALTDAAGRSIELTIIAGQYEGTRAPAPPPKSWASRSDTDLAIWTIKLAPQARFSLPGAGPLVARSLYFFEGKTLRVAGRELTSHAGLTVRADVPVELVNGDAPGEVLLLQARPIGEPVVQHGPFVMNSASEIQQAFVDYRRTQFGGWPWPSDDPVHAADAPRFAVHADGREEHPR